MASQVSVYVYRSPQGPLTIAAKGKAITNVILGDMRAQDASLAHQMHSSSATSRLSAADALYTQLQRGTATWAPSDAANRCATQLMEYFVGKRKAFDVDTAPAGSDFQKAVWRAISRIPYAQTRTPQQIAEAMGKPQSYRMVGSALKACPIAIIIPTHRVIGANGKPLGIDAESRLKTACLKLEERFRNTTH